MKKHRLLVVEDDMLIGRIVEEIVKVHFPELEVLKTCNSVSGAIDSIKTWDPDLVILDININEGTAFDILDQLNPISFKVIFMSSFQESLVQALKFAAVEFVYKPFDVSDMVSAIDKALDLTEPEDGSISYAHRIETLLENVKLDPHANKLVLSGSNSHRIVPIRDVLWIEAQVSKSLFHFIKQPPFEARLPLRRFEAMLKDRGFYRCHPYYLVNLSHVEYVDPVLNIVNLTGGSIIALESRKYDGLMYHLLIRKSMPSVN